MGFEETPRTMAAMTGWAYATHCCVVEIDPETGQVALERYVVVEDCGR